MPKVQDWIHRVWAEFDKSNLTRTMRDCLLTLKRFQGVGGLCIPSHATLAERVKCSVSTVKRALRQAVVLGLIQVTERRVRAGGRWVRTSNSYHLLQPDGPVRAGMRLSQPIQSTGQNNRGVKSIDSKRVFQAMQDQAAGFPDLLALRRAVMEARALNQLDQGSNGGGQSTWK